MPVCQGCGQNNPDGFQFCSRCGTALVAEPPSRVERKQVTALFCDLVGSTTLGENLDVEDLESLLGAYHSHVREELERFGGTVEKFIGDAVVAVFGAPVAHEDDPERAVRAALAIRDWAVELGEFQLRIAVNTGEALIRIGARAAAGEHFASGDVLNTAARLQSAAPVDGILVGEATHHATERAIEYRELEPVAAKGKAEPVRAWEALQARSRFGVDLAHASSGSLVGRSRELGVLSDALERVRAEQTAQLITLVGVPGIGKSRLVAELFSLVDRQEEFTTWRQGRSLPYGETQSFWALAELVKAEAGIREDDGLETTRQKLVEMVEAAVSEPERVWVLGHLEPLTGIAVAGDAAGDRASDAFAAWRRLLESLAEQHPLVLVFEDLHWADDGLLDFIDHLSEWVTTVPILIVATARPELLERRPGWGGGKRNASTLSITPLTDADTARLLGALLESVVLPAEVHAAVLQRAAGNPLYAEEYVRMLQDRGFLERTGAGWRLTTSAELPLPETIQAIVSARLDALPPDEKAVIQDASVVGKVFWPSALSSADPDTLDHALHGLVRKEFIRRDRQAAVTNETQYAFVHALIRDVTYGQLPRADRARMHRTVAGWIEQLSPERAQDRAEMLAHHYGVALRLAQALGEPAGDLVPKAQAALVAASERAELLNAWRAACDRATEGLTLMDDDDPRQPALAVRVARGSHCLAENDVDVAVRARQVSERLGDPERAAEAEALRSLMLWYRGEGGPALEAADAAVAIVADRPPSSQKARALANRARRASLQDDSELALRLAAEAESIASALGLGEIVSHALNTRGMARIELGELDGFDDLRRSVAIAQDGNHVHEWFVGLNNLANLNWYVGRLDEGAQEMASYVELAERLGAPAYMEWGQGGVVLVPYLRGEYRDLVKLATAALAQLPEGTSYQEIPMRSMLAVARAASGSAALALAEAPLALTAARAADDPQVLAPALVAMAMANWAGGRAAELERAVDELLGTPTLLHYGQWVSPLALLLQELGQSDRCEVLAGALSPGTRWREAAGALADGRRADAAAIYETIGSRFLAGWASLLAAEHGEFDADRLREAAAHFDRAGATPYAARCAELSSGPSSRASTRG